MTSICIWVYFLGSSCIYAGARPKPTVKIELLAFLDTDLYLYIDGGEGWRNYAKLGAQVANTSEWGAEPMNTHVAPVVLRLKA